MMNREAVNHNMEKEFKISGMSCTSCARTIEKGVEKLSFVEQATVNFATGLLKVVSTEDHSEAIIERVKKLGYSAQSLLKTTGRMAQKEFAVSGMSCTSCARAIEEAVRKLPCVEQADVNFATARLTVVFLQEEKIEEILGTVEKLGYQAEFIQKSVLSAKREEKSGQSFSHVIKMCIRDSSWIRRRHPMSLSKRR